MPSAAEVRALEEVGYGIWVAPEVEELDGWRLRYAGGLTNRANTVFPNANGSLPLDERIERAERWYAARGAGTGFQVTEASLPAGLADALARRGYAVASGPVSVQTAELPALEPDPRVEVAAEPSDDWVTLWGESRGASDAGIARALLTGGAGRTAFAQIPGLAVGRAVAIGEWLGVTSMLTVPAARRRGLGRAVLATLVAWGRAAGARRGYLQTENPVAIALYGSLGFAERYTYRHFRRP
jgi:N-acetylglutamate synthase